MKEVLGKCCLFHCVKNLLFIDIMAGLVKRIQENTARRKQRTFQEKHELSIYCIYNFQRQQLVIDQLVVDCYVPSRFTIAP